MNFKHYINSGFVSCTLVAKAYDHIRHRDVRIYLVPGYPEDLGVTDGVDSWVCPLSCNPFSVNVARVVADIVAGKPYQVVDGTRGLGTNREKKRRVILFSPPQDEPTVEPPPATAVRRTRVDLQT